MSGCRIICLALTVLALTGWPAGADEIRTVTQEPAPDARHGGEKVLVDDGSCPSGQIKEVIGGSNKSFRHGVEQPGTPRQSMCIPRGP
jgi:hypothetical protein